MLRFAPITPVRKSKMNFTRTCIALAGAAIILVPGAVRPQAATLSWVRKFLRRQYSSDRVFRPGIRFSIAAFHWLGCAQSQKIVEHRQSVLLPRFLRARLCAVAAIHTSAAKPWQHLR